MTGSGTKRRVVGALAMMVALSWPAAAVAQSVGIGPRLAFVSGTDNPLLAGSNESKARFTGGVVRVRFGRLAVEGAVDYKETKDPAGTATIKSYPIQASLLYYMGAAKSGLYLVGGVGYYTQHLDLVLTGDETFDTAAHSVGYHVGAGLELSLGRRASIFTDYRYTFADPPSFSELTNAIVGATLTPVFSPDTNVQGLDTRGSMWTTGMTIIF